MAIIQQHVHITVHGNVQQHFGITAPGNVNGAADSFSGAAELGEILKIKPEITFNNTRKTKTGRKAPDGIEIRFGDFRPTEATRQELKDHKFQFSEKQTMWYALDNELSRSLVERWEKEPVEVDNTQYIKQHFWARVKSRAEYEALRPYNEFMVAGIPPQFFANKAQFQRAYTVTDDLFRQEIISFKKFYNTPVNEGDDPGEDVADPAIIAQKLEDAADRMEDIIKEKMNPAIGNQRPTARRNRIAEGIRREGRILQAQQEVLYALANGHREGFIEKYPLLNRIRAKNEVSVVRYYDSVISGSSDANRAFSSRQDTLNKIGIETIEQWGQAYEQLSELMQFHNPNSSASMERETAAKIKELENKAGAAGIPGFFPTPPQLIDRLLDLADLKAGQQILEPSAGKGDILDAIVARVNPGHNLHACEINSTLREILSLKKHMLVATDFLEYKPATHRYDRIVMNPPFENGLDVIHVTHALSLLKPNGRLVAIMSEGVFFRNNKRDNDFRELLTRMGAYVSEPIKEGFSKGFVPTGWVVRIVAINNDGTPATEIAEDSTESAIPGEIDEDMELLEIEALAELEIMKMQAEAAKRKADGDLSGINELDPVLLQKFRDAAHAYEKGSDVFDFK